MEKEISRRSFIKGTVMATGAGLLVSCAPKVIETGVPEDPTAVPTAAPTKVVSAEAKVASATVQGHGGDVTVTLTVQDGKILDCQIVGDGETPGVGARAVEQMPAQYVEAGTLEVDGVAGATVTTTAIKSAASMAYNDAMGISVGNIKMKPGTYTSSALGHWGIWKLPVTITVSETALLDIAVPENRYEHGETEVILQSVKDKLFPRMIEHQSVRVDSIAGATESSDAVKISVENALKEALVAGGSEETAIQYFYNVPEKTEEGVVEEKDVDILVLGMGAGGIMAMLSAMETIQSLNGDKRVSILGIEKAGKIGGRSCMTHEANAVNPPNYLKKYNDGKPMVDAADYKKKWLAFDMGKDGVQRCKPELLDLFFAESGKTIDWMYEQCYRFGSPRPSAMIGGNVSYNSVNTIMVDPGTYEDRRKIVDTYYKKMLATVVAQGGEYLLETQAYEYITEGDAVVGVKARNHVTGKEYIVHARAVIQGTGGFGANQEMLNKLLSPKFAGERKNVGMNMDTGEMFQAALDLGAGTWNIDMSPNVMTIGLPHYLTLYPVNEDKSGMTGRTGRYRTWTLNDIPLGMGFNRECLAIDPTGKRFDDEGKLADFGKSLDSESYTSFQAGPYYLVLYSQDRIDELAANGFVKGNSFGTYLSQGGVPTETPLPETQSCIDQCIIEGMAWKGETIEELAANLNIEPDVLVNTIETYNTYCDNGVDEEFGKDPASLKKLATGPYYAIKLMNAPFATCGSLDVDTQIRVLKQDHETPIPGLYAIGTDSLGVLLNNERNYNGFGGVAMGWYNMSGRLAGINAANYVNDTYGVREASFILEPPAA
jgi:uncharacterized protein with FMN-binding domain/predicted oxidoreductase